jgi:type II secretory pathway pseudopilin PulG
MPRALKRILYVVAGSFALVILAFMRNYSRDLMRQQETAAIGAIRTIQTAQLQYFSRYGRYGTSLRELGPAAAGFIDGELASLTKDGYNFTLAGNASEYVIHADPVEVGKSGMQSFYSDETLVIRQNYGRRPATVNSPELK